MKTLKLSIALIICAAAVSSCKDDAMVSASDAERTGISRAPQHGDYSWYIISPDEAIDMVVKDLEKSGGEFVKKQISHVEPVMIEGIKHLINPELFENDFIAASDPAFYIVHFKEEGYALVNPDKFFGGNIVVSAQTKGKIAAEEFYKLEPSDGDITLDEWLEYDAYMAKLPGQGSQDPPIPTPKQWLEEMMKGKKSFIKWWDDHYDKMKTDLSGFKITKRSTPNDIITNLTGSGESLVTYNWKVVEDNNTHPDLFMSSNSPLNSYHPNYQMGTAAPTLLNFIGFFGGTSTFLFGQTGSWALIKNNGYFTAPAPFWAYEIDQYCTTAYNVCDENGNSGGTMTVKDSPNKALMFLQENGYPSAELKTYACSARNWYNGAISDILKSGKPLVIFTLLNTAALAHREVIEEELKFNPYINDYQYSYRSWIHYFTGDGREYKILNSTLSNRMSYIVY